MIFLGTMSPLGRQCLLLHLVHLARAAISGEVLVGGTEPLRVPMGVSFAPNGQLLVVDTDNHRVLQCPGWQQGFSQQSCSVLAGTGSGGFEASQLRTPYVAIPVQVSGHSFSLVIADTHNHRIQYWPSGATSGRTLVGGPGFGAPTYDGPGELQFPAGLAIDEAKGFMYVADTGHHRVVRYALDVQQMQVLGSGQTVAGTDGTPGSNQSLLDNPTALALSGDRLYVADARNSRLMTWLVREELLQLETPVRRLSSVGDENTTGTETTMTTTSMTLTTSYTISTTSTTTYTGPRYSLEMDGFTGRPYGIYVNDGGIYVSDADGCVIWKKTPSGQKSLVVGGTCGFSTSQLYFPAGLVVETGGAIIIADSRNNRIIRFGSEPTPSNVEKCTLGGNCEVVLRNGLPTSRSRLLLVKSTTQTTVNGACGGGCVDSGLGGGSWVSLPGPQPPLLTVMIFPFGVAGYGETMRDYIMCYGPEGNAEEVASGNCSSMPYNVGTVRMLPYLSSTPSTECVTGTPCTADLDGYGIPAADLVVVAIIDSAYGTGVACGTGSTQNFQGYRAFFLQNPGFLQPIVEPYLSQGNRSANVQVFFGEALGQGSQLLCACYEGNDCNSPSRFKEPIGYIRVRSALTNSLLCRWGESCVLNVSGQYLRDTDVAVLTPSYRSCTSLSFQEASSIQFDNPVANASSATVSSMTSSDGLNFAFFDLGTARDNGMFPVCYCASYDGEDADDQTCSSAAEFTHSAGSLVIMRVNSQDYECAMNRACSVEVSGLYMAATDILLDAGGSATCGSIVPQEAAVVGGVSFQQNFFAAQAGATSDPNASQLFQLITFTVPGDHRLCYCSSYDADPNNVNDQIQGPCNDAVEFIQPVGLLTIRGPSYSVISCAANVPCEITVSGSRLATDDQLQVCSVSSGCGNTSACAAVGPNALGGPLSPNSATSTQASFGLGSLPVGTYLLCYCAPGTSSTAPISCSSPEDLDTQAGQLRVRGVDSGQLFECAENTPCAFTVTGFDLSTTDMVMAVPLSGQCGVTDGNFAVGAFNPNSRSRASVNVGSSTGREFGYDSITAPERYKICYCVFAQCVNASHFTEEVGTLVVKGIQRSRFALTCVLGERCNVAFNGSGFEISTDSLKLIPSGIPCGGVVLRMAGDGSNNTQPFLGFYDVGTMIYNGRNYYKQRGGSHLVSYNIFRGWWVISTDLESKDAPLAWAEGRDYYAPNQLPLNSWQIWIVDNITVIGAGYWYAHPTLRMAGAVDDNFAFSINPSAVMTQITTDVDLGLPYLSSATFDVGTASTAGTYNLCWCPSWDWPVTNAGRSGDLDTIPCSSEQEFFVNNGNLVVGFLTSQARYHCLPADCSIGIALPAYLRNQRAVVLPGDIKCAEAVSTMASPWSSSRNVSGTVPSVSTNWTLFSFGTASVMGEFQVCVCSDFDNGQDSVTCSQLSEFYEAADTLTVADQVFLVFEAGVNAALNVTRGYGLDASDRIYFQPGFACNASSLGSTVASPSNVEANGAWAIYALGPQGLSLDSGLYVACLCTNFDGPDSDEVSCNSADEFTTAVGKLQVAAVQGPQLRSSISGSILLRLTLARRLSATDAAAVSSGWALATALEAALKTAFDSFISPVSVEVTGVSPLRGPGTVDVVANFTATFNGSANQQLLEVRAFDNASCPDELLEPPWTQPTGLVTTPAFADSPLLLGCLRLNDVITNEGTALQSTVATELQSASLSGISGIEVTSFGTMMAPVLGYLPEIFRCVRGAPCQIPVAAATGAASVPAGGSMLLIGSGLCGAEDSQRLTTVLASNPVDATASTSTSGRLVNLGDPLLEGSYTLCYCAGSDSGSGSCGSSRDFFSLVGSLTVRGPSSSLAAYCVVYKACTVALFGVELSIWDGLLVKDGTGGSCYDSNVVGFGASSHFVNNPATLPSKDSVEQFFFDLGTASQTGTYQLCYCASYSSQGGSVPCQSPADFSMQAGTLYVRGVQQINTASYSCVRSSKGDGEAECALPVEGTGLMAVQDKMLVIPVTTGNSSCGEVEPSPTFGISPNPVPLRISTSNVTRWGAVDSASVAQWTVQRLELPGNYQVCYCADSPDGSLDSRGECFSGAAGFYHEMGSLEVRGADPAQMFLCVPGKTCDFVVTGVNLSISDKVRLVGPEDSCSRPKPLVTATKIDFNQAVEANQSSARFDLGVLELTQPMALRLCYCASYNRDGQGSACSDVADFTHAAGVVNVAICPVPPGGGTFVVPVQDVYGDPGDPKFRFYSLPAWLCHDAGSRTSSDIAKYQSIMLLGSGGLEGKGGQSGEEDLVYSSRVAQCIPGIEAAVPRFPNSNISTTDVSVVGGARANINGLPIDAGFRLQGSMSLSDERGNMQTCASWEVELVSFGCGWDAAMTFGMVLHLLLFVTIIWSCFSNQIYHCSAFCSWTKKVEPIVETDPEEKEEALRRAADAIRRMPTVATTGTPSVKAIAAGGASIAEPDRPLQLLCSSRTACILAAVRMTTVILQLLLVLCRFDDVLIFFVMPLLMAFVSLVVQVALVWAAWDLRRTRRCFKRPQYVMHSFTLTLKLHLDLVVPLMAQRHHSELWRPAAVLVFLQLLVQVLLPVCMLLYGLRSGRRRLPTKSLARPMMANPRPAAPDSLEVMEVDVTDSKVQAVMQETLYKPENRRGSLSVTDPTGMTMAADMANQLTLEKLPRGVSVQKGNLGLQGIATSSDVTAVNVAARRNSIQHAKPRPGKRRRNSVEFLVGGLPLEPDETSPSTVRHRRASADLYASMEDDPRAPTKGSLTSLTSSAESMHKREELVLHMFRMKALEEHLNTQKPRWRCVLGSVCFSALVFPCSCCARRFKRLRWKGALCRSSWEEEASEEFRRQRIVGLWAFLDTSGWSVAAMQFRKQAEGAGGFSLPHFEDRRACISCAVGGFDLAVLSLALVGIYLPRLNYTELSFLLLAAVVTLLQVGRPGIFHAASALADDLFLNPQSLLGFFLCAVLLRCLVIAVIGFGCASFSWSGYLLSTVSLLILWGPVLLFCWRSWPVIWNIVTGFKAPWPSKISTMFTDFGEMFLPARLKEKNHRLNWNFKNRPVVLHAPTPPAVTRAPGATRKLDAERPPSPPNLRDAAYKVLAYRKEQGKQPEELQTLPAEPCLAALVQLVEDIVYGVPQELGQRILDQQGEVAQLHHLFVDLNRQPPHLEDKKRRVRRLLEAMTIVDKLATVCQYMGPMTRLSYDELHAQVLEELWLARSMVGLDTLLRSRHFCRGCLASRASLLEAQIPTAPRFWLVHDQTLQRLGRIPMAREFEHLTTASDAHQAHGRNAIVMVVVHRWRSTASPDLHGVTWRQLVTFARWYRWRWGEEHELFFWIDCCCMPEIRGRLPEKHRVKPDIWADDDQLMPMSPDSTGPQSNFAKMMDRRGLANLAAWSQATGNNLDDEDYVEEVVDQAYLDMTAGRKEDADFAGLDAMLPAIFAASHGVVMCNSHDSEKDAWCRLYLSLAYAFLPCGRLMYEVKRDLVHISREMRKRRKEAAEAERRLGGLRLEDAGEDHLSPLGDERMNSKMQETIPSSLAVTAPSETAPSGTNDAETIPEAEVRLPKDCSLLARHGPAEKALTNSGLKHQDTGTKSELKDLKFLEECLDRFVEDTEAESYEKLLPVPTDWDNLLLEDEWDMGRIQRLKSVSMDAPTLPTDTGYKRRPLEYGKTKMLICCLGGPKRDARRKVRLTQEEESSSESEEEQIYVEEEDTEEPPDLPVVPYTYKEESEEDKMLELYFNRSIKKEEEADPKDGTLQPFSLKKQTTKSISLGTTISSWFNATSPALTRSLQPPPLRLTLASAPAVQRFHETFVSRAVKTDVKKRVAERIGENNTFLPTASVGSGGMALLSKPLAIRGNVCPDSPASRGVTFDVVLEEVDSRPNRDGLAIGFTAQDPEDWPLHRKAIPQTALEMPRSCVVGYSGRWVTPGNRELVKGSYNPAKLRRGDVLTAVIAGQPANLMRILLNGKVVAQKPLSFTGLDPSAPLWGLLDLEGSCVKLRLGSSLLE